MKTFQFSLSCISTAGSENLIFDYVLVKKELIELGESMFKQADKVFIHLSASCN